MKKYLHCASAFNFPVGTRRKLNVHKTFRRLRGRLLNVLCTFNLRPVSTGMLLPKSKVNVRCPKRTLDAAKYNVNVRDMF